MNIVIQLRRKHAKTNDMFFLQVAKKIISLEKENKLLRKMTAALINIQTEDVCMDTRGLLYAAK